MHNFEPKEYFALAKKKAWWKISIPATFMHVTDGLREYETDLVPKLHPTL